MYDSIKQCPVIVGLKSAGLHRTYVLAYFTLHASKQGLAVADVVKIAEFW